MNASSEKFTTKASSCGIRCLDQIERALVDGRPFLRHRSGVIDHQRNRDGKVGVLKADDVLLHAIFENREVLFLQILDQLVAIQHRRVEHHFFHIGVQNETAALLAHAFACIGAQRWRCRASAPGRGPPRAAKLAQADWAFVALKAREPLRLEDTARSALLQWSIVAGASMNSKRRQPLGWIQLYLHFTPLAVAVHVPWACIRSRTDCATRSKSSPQCRSSPTGHRPGTCARRSPRIAHSATAGRCALRE